MLQGFKNQKWFSMLWMALGLVVLNCSVAITTLQPVSALQQATFNNQESMVELVVEKLLGFEHAIPEESGDDTEQHHQQKISFKLEDCIVQNTVISSLQAPQEGARSQLVYVSRRATTPFFKIHTPPPDFLFVDDLFL